jgi:photosystem II stability/assembly factor-like uncharacterized protein
MIFPQNSNTGYAIEPDQVLKTTNQGLTWSVIKTTPNSFFGKLEGFDDNHIYIIGVENFFNKIIKTSDGGSNWQTMILPLAGIGVCVMAMVKGSFIKLLMEELHGPCKTIPMQHPLPQII